MYHKGEIAGQRRIGFLVKLKFRNQIIGFEGISDRIAVLHINLPRHTKILTIVQVYSPRKQATRDDILNFYEKLSKVTEKYSKNNIVLMCDFNAQVAARHAGEDHIIGKYSRGKRIKNGEQLVEILFEQILTIFNSKFRK